MCLFSVIPPRRAANHRALHDAKGSARRLQSSHSRPSPDQTLPTHSFLVLLLSEDGAVALSASAHVLQVHPERYCAHYRHAALVPAHRHRNRRQLSLPQETHAAPPARLTVVSKDDAKAGQSGSFGGTVDEWFKILFNALFSLGGEDELVEAQISRKNDNLTVLAFSVAC
jgi:hypothetical protein